jgi:hypothetical protein
MAPSDIEKLKSTMRAAEAALMSGTGTRAEWTDASVAYYLAIHPEDRTDAPRGGESGIPSVEQIRARAAIADRADKAIPRMGRIDPLPGRHDEWSARLGWSDATLSAVLTADLYAAVSALKGGNLGGLEYSVRFLEADPWCIGSGYTKEALLSAMVKIELDAPMQERLRRVVISVVDDSRPRREIKRYGTLARAIATADLRVELEARLTSEDSHVRFNARAVLERLA